MIIRSLRDATRLTWGNTFAMSWLPVTDKARSTIMARRPLEGGISVALKRVGYHRPFRRLTHPLRDPCERLRARFLERLDDRLESLLIGCIVEQISNQVIKTHLSVFG